MQRLCGDIQDTTCKTKRMVNIFNRTRQIGKSRETGHTTLWPSSLSHRLRMHYETAFDTSRTRDNVILLSSSCNILCLYDYINIIKIIIII